MSDAGSERNPPDPVAVAPARFAAMSWDTVLRGIDAVLQSDAGRLEKAVRTAELIRQAGGYRWVGLYEVTGQEIAVLGWSGPGAPAYPCFPVTQGLSGVAARRWSGAPPPSPACLPMDGSEEDVETDGMVRARI